MSKINSKASSWPIGIAIIYGVFMLSLFSFLFFASVQRTDLISKNYYEQELQYQQQIDRQERSNRLQEKPVIEYDRASKAFRLQFPDDFDPAQVEGEITFFRPSNASLDYTVPISLDPTRNQLIRAKSTRKGLWKVKIIWKLDAAGYYHEEIIILP